ncbi:hypothetical protein ILYODFUR_020399 [Ilyodon furcidens]|uniref:Uncharacterized protein n=1 Tax=Ilyodon furcidens TaxID=33524 RepID=A0ABV0SZ27_9TELE
MEVNKHQNSIQKQLSFIIQNSSLSLSCSQREAGHVTCSCQILLDNTTEDLAEKDSSRMQQQTNCSRTHHTGAQYQAAGGGARSGAETMQWAHRPSHTEDRGITTMTASWKQLPIHILLILASCRHISSSKSHLG